jgi:hypothetical protein
MSGEKENNNGKALEHRQLLNAPVQSNCHDREGHWFMGPRAQKILDDMCILVFVDVDPQTSFSEDNRVGRISISNVSEATQNSHEKGSRK